MYVVTFQPRNTVVRAGAGMTILQAARKAGITLEAPCNGAGTCGKCAVRVELDDPADLFIHEGHRLSPAQEARGLVLSCQAEIRGDVSVHLEQREENGLQVLTGGIGHGAELSAFIRKRFDPALFETKVFAGDDLLCAERGDTAGEVYGVVADIGTTTLVVSLVDLTTGKELVSLSALNPQSLHAQDVLSRIRFAGEEDGIGVMHLVLTSELNRLITRAAAKTGVDPGNVYEVVYSGNTCMLHLATATDPAPLGKYPFTPVITGGNHLPASGIGLAVAKRGLLYLPPVISAYVGADITAGIIAAGLHRLPGTTLFIDIGTNGEMVLSRDGSLTATSTAAGPAFEGMNISCGMRASVGAIEYFHAADTGVIELKTIGDAEPVGICGSGLLDIVAELVGYGVIDKRGRLAPPGSGGTPGFMDERLTREHGKVIFRISDNVYLSQKDVRQVQLAKGAIRAGISILLQEKGIEADMVDRVLIAGSFGCHLRERSLLALGLLPGEFAGKVEFVGNTARSGGEALLLNTGLRLELEGLVPDIEVVELTARKDFDRVFMDAMGF